MRFSIDIYYTYVAMFFTVYIVILFQHLCIFKNPLCLLFYVGETHDDNTQL